MTESELEGILTQLQHLIKCAAFVSAFMFGGNNGRIISNIRSVAAVGLEQETFSQDIQSADRARHWIALIICAVSRCQQPIGPVTLMEAPTRTQPAESLLHLTKADLELAFTNPAPKVSRPKLCSDKINVSRTLKRIPIIMLLYFVLKSDLARSGSKSLFWISCSSFAGGLDTGSGATLPTRRAISIRKSMKLSAIVCSSGYLPIPTFFCVIVIRNLSFCLFIS